MLDCTFTRPSHLLNVSGVLKGILEMLVKPLDRYVIVIIAISYNKRLRLDMPVKTIIEILHTNDGKTITLYVTDYSEKCTFYVSVDGKIVYRGTEERAAQIVEDYREK